MHTRINHNSYYSRSCDCQTDKFFKEFTSLFKDSPFWIAFLIWALVPATKTPYFIIINISINSKDILLILTSVIYLIFLIKYSLQKETKKCSNQTFIFYIFILLGYAMLSILWSDMNKLNKTAMFYTLTVTTFSIVLSYSVIYSRSIENSYNMLRQLTIALALISALYVAESFFSLGLRTSSQYYDFGIERVRGPLFGSSTGHFILLPALGFSILSIIIAKNHGTRTRWIICSFFLIIALIALGSRASIITCSIFVFLMLLNVETLKRKLLLFLLVSAITIPSILFVFSKASTDRLKYLEDTSRKETYVAALNEIKDRDMISVIFGKGYGSVWAWYIPDSENARATGQYSFYTQYGRLLYHPHSTPLLLIVELGIIGLFFFIAIIYYIAHGSLRNVRYNYISIFRSSIIASCFAMLVDYFLFKNWLLSTIWWIYVFGMIRITTVQSNSNKQT